MTLTITLLIVLIVAVIGLGVYLVRNSKQSLSDEDMTRLLETRLNTMMGDFLKTSNENLINLANEKLGAEKKEIKGDLESKRAEIERMVKAVQEDLKLNQQNLMNSDKERIGSFRALEKSLEEYKQITGQLATTTEGLKKVLSNNQMRGQFGEQVAEDLLKMSGFVKGLDYEFNKKQENTESRPDFAVFMPDGTRINVDSKFPFANLQKMAETEDPGEKSTHQKQFERDVKDKIKQISTRNYINPEDKTVDFVILFIPNEMIFSYIYEKMPDVWHDAMEQKVVMAGPFSFTAILRMVRQAYDSFKYQSNIHKVIGEIKMFEKEFKKFSDEFTKVGDRIAALDKQYQSVNGTRTNQLERRMEKVKLIDGGDEVVSAIIDQPMSPVQPSLIED